MHRVVTMAVHTLLPVSAVITPAELSRLPVFEDASAPVNDCTRPLVRVDAAGTGPDAAPVDCSALSGWHSGQQRRTRARVFDLFILDGEVDLAEARMHELDAVVDIFVIVEASRTFKGSPKPSHMRLNWRRFAPFSHKIAHVYVAWSSNAQSTRAAHSKAAWICHCA